MEIVKKLLCNRWLVLVAAIWVQSCAGIGYVFGSLSPVIKKNLRYNQKQINALGVAKDLGDSVGFFAGLLCEYLPTWGILLVGALQNLAGYGWLWLIVIGRVSRLPFWAICVLIYIGTNGETFFNTAALVTCVRTFPRSRGPIVGFLKGFTGLSGAIFAQIYATLYAPNQASFIFMVAVGPSMVAVAMMFLLRPVSPGGGENGRDRANFNFIYSICLLLASYLLGVMLIEDLVDVSRAVTSMFTIVLLGVLVLPLALPLVSVCCPCLISRDAPADDDVDASCVDRIGKKGTESEVRAPLLKGEDQGRPHSHGEEEELARQSSVDVLVEQHKNKVALLEESEKARVIARLESSWFQAAAKGAASVRWTNKGPRRGQDFTLMQALIKADFWLLFLALTCGGGSGVTIIDNLGQMSESLGYAHSHIFVSMISIWNFLGRVGAGFLSEIVARDYAYPRPLAMAGAQIIMAIGQLVFATAWPGCLYGGTLLVGLGYGAHWSIVPATASELFGLKNFGALYNFITMANPAGSLIFSGLIAGTIYDWEAEKQMSSSNPFHKLMRVSAGPLQSDAPLKCTGAVCFFVTYLTMSGVSIVGVCLSLALSYRTRGVYRSIYGKNHSDNRSKATHHGKSDSASAASSSSAAV
uniref:Uncharacterized protein n=1 Tax=Araucaria cunninghamii TaxID=56994 RepID=A0A0D6R7U8_ARACU